MTVDKELKRKITARWNILSDGKAGEWEKAFAQLEYILLEAGLLAKRRKRRKNSRPSRDEMDEVAADAKWESPRYEKEEA